MTPTSDDPARALSPRPVDIATGVDPACPATVVSGAHDLSWFSAVADHLAADLPRATRVDLPWAGHLPNLERPAGTTQLLRHALLH